MRHQIQLKSILYVIALVAILGCGREEEIIQEAAPEIVLCYFGLDVQMLFISITDQNGDDLFLNSDYNSDSVSISYLHEDNYLNENDVYYTHDKEITLSFERDGSTIIGFPFGGSGISRQYLIDFNNGDIDTLSLDNHLAFLPRQYQLTDRIVDFFYNGQLMDTWDIERDEELMDRYYRDNRTASFPLTGDSFSDPVVVSFVK